MLLELRITDFAIVSHLSVSFTDGLNAVTGETGAGKSILVSALAIALGGKAGADVVRSDARLAIVEAVFAREPSEELDEALATAGTGAGDDTLVLGREVYPGGRSVARINGRPVPSASLRDVGLALVDLHGQHDHQSLLNAARHGPMFDAWCGRDLGPLVTAAVDAHASVTAARAECTRLAARAQDRAQRIDLLDAELTRIRTTAPQPGEDARLEERVRRAAAAEQLAGLTDAASAALGDDPGAVDLLRGCVANLERAAGLDAGLAGIAGTIRTALFELEEAARDIESYKRSLESDEVEVDSAAERLEELRALKRRFGGSLDDVLAYAARAESELSELMEYEERSDGARRTLELAQEAQVAACDALSTARRRMGATFARLVAAELHDLAMTDAAFMVEITPQEPGPRGADRIQFLIAANPGEPCRPLARVASGGEISRTMLAIKAALARQEPLPTMVFDEIDSGTGGRTATVIADKLSHLARSAQIICITHLAPIAAQAHTHLRIEKTTESGRAAVSVVPAAGEERVTELARMLGGSRVTAAVTQTAREMLAGRSGESQ